jgi:hypothetical protein
VSARFQFSGEIQRYAGEAAWFFITVPKATSADMRAISAGLRNAFGSLRVVATIGATEWRTSVFADRKADAFLLPVKADVRRKEKVGHGDKVAVTLEIEL